MATGIQTATDPFSLLENALWFALDSHPAVTALVKVGNTVRFCSDRAPPDKQALQAADMPELALMPSGVANNRINTSSSAGFVQRYVLAIYTGDERTSGGENKRAGLSQVKFACIKALAMYRAGIPDLPFCRRVAIGDGAEKIDGGGTQDRPAPIGWSTLLPIECDMDIPWAEIDA